MGKEINEVEMSGHNGDATVIDIEVLTEIFRKKKLHDWAGRSINYSYVDGITEGDSLQFFLQQGLDALPGKTCKTRPVTIFRVPIFRDGVKNMHEPQMVSIGPYHHGKEILQPLEKHKWWHLRDFLSRKPDISMEVYLKEMRAMSAQARQCYNDVFEMSTDEFAFMLLLDGCFILEYFLKGDDGEPDYVTSVGWATVDTDFLLLENQIPFSVIHKLGTIYYGTEDHNCDNECPVLNLVQKKMVFKSSLLDSVQVSCGKINHLLHLYQLRMIPPIDMEQTGNPDQASNLDQTNNLDQNINLDQTSNTDQTSNLDQSSNSDQTSTNTDNNQLLSIKAQCLSWIRSKLGLQPREVDLYRIPSATELQEAGVTFKEKNDPRDMFDITFENGVMEIPFISISDGTKILFTNVLLNEQAQDGRIPKTLTSYLILMDFLIDTSDDVALLKNRGILGNFLPNDEEVALFFNQLCDYTMIDLGESYYNNLSEQVINYINLPWHSYRAMLVRDYFSNPWAVISFVAAILLLLLTVTQTGFSIYPVVHSN